MQCKEIARSVALDGKGGAELVDVFPALEFYEVGEVSPSRFVERDSGNGICFGEPGSPDGKVGINGGAFPRNREGEQVGFALAVDDEKADAAAV